MKMDFAYLGNSNLRMQGGNAVLNLMPNLKRDPVAFDAALCRPLRFREAISALHDVVISDLRFKPRDKSAYEAWKKSEAQRQSTMRRQAYEDAEREILARREEVPKDLTQRYERLRKRYWGARQAYSNWLLKNDQEMWRLLMPCDPVVTVAEDVVFFECFSADESSYGCLTVARGDGFGPCGGVKFGTTNVDYSWDLYNHFQSLRTYRETRFRVDPQGFEVATAGRPDYREEKIDLPDGWLRGFMQIQGAMGLPMRKVTLSREAVYSLLAFLRRHKARKSPRALRFELLPGRAPQLVLEPWEQRVVSHGTKYDGPSGEPVRIWGKPRLLSLARLLPLAERFDVYLLGTGLPSFWVASMGEMRLTLGLSGWTTNDWTRSSSLDLLAAQAEFPRSAVYALTRFLKERGKATFQDLQMQSGTTASGTAAALNHLAHAGQLIKDLDANVFRWRQVVSQVEGDDAVLFGMESEELTAAKLLLARLKIRIERREVAPNGAQLVAGNAEGKPVEAIVDADGMIRRGACKCSHHFKYGIRKGPCRHLLALRELALRGELQGDWYERLVRWAKN